MRIAQLRTIIEQRMSTVSSALGTLVPAQIKFSRACLTAVLHNKSCSLLLSRRLRKSDQSRPFTTKVFIPSLQAGRLFELPHHTFIFHTPVTLFTTPSANHRIVGEFMLTLRPMISNKKTIYDHVVEGHD